MRAQNWVALCVFGLGHRYCFFVFFWAILYAFATAKCFCVFMLSVLLEFSMLHVKPTSACFVEISFHVFLIVPFLLCTECHPKTGINYNPEAGLYPHAVY